MPRSSSDEIYVVLLAWVSLPLSHLSSLRLLNTLRVTQSFCLLALQNPLTAQEAPQLPARSGEQLSLSTSEFCFSKGYFPLTPPNSGQGDANQRGRRQWTESSALSHWADTCTPSAPT